jgi:hypothetical protein
MWGRRGVRNWAALAENFFSPRADCLILSIGSFPGDAMAKPKKKTFSAAKAVKANARERVGQPKPSRVLPDAPKTGRKAKHKTKMGELIDGTKGLGTKG